MAWHHLDIEAGLRRIADRRIEEAMKEGKFDNLAGMGQPLDLEPLPADESARALWWALKIMRNGNFTPDEVRWRKQIDLIMEKIDTLTDESELPEMVDQANGLVHKINTMGTNANCLPVVRLDFQSELTKLRQRRALC
jgi:hypothetical protein